VGAGRSDRVFKLTDITEHKPGGDLKLLGGQSLCDARHLIKLHD
jgi:hypothetical protein